MPVIVSQFGCRLASVVLTLLLAVFVAASAAQTATATLGGVVVDTTGAALVGAQVTATNHATRLQRAVTTGADGRFAIVALPPGRYVVRVAHPGFMPNELRDLVLNVNDQIDLRLELNVGGIGEAVSVLAERSRISTSPAVSTLMDRQFVENLPLNGRSFQSLILLTPGVTVTVATAGTDAGQFSVNGQRASANSFIVDGVSANVGISTIRGGTANLALAGSYPGLSAFGGTNTLVSVDALEEYKIQTSTYAAEFGRQPGGQVSLVTRSGTNVFHGSLFEYLRNDALDARDYFNRPPAPKPALRQHQFGGTLGGPIVKDAMFFFASYEGQRLRLPAAGSTYVPSLRLRALAADGVKPFLAGFPQPDPATPEQLDASGQPSGWTLYSYAVSNPSTLDAGSVRVDHNIGGKLLLFGRFNNSPSDSTTLSTANGLAFGAASRSSTQTLTAGATSALTSTISHELRFNYSRQQARLIELPSAVGGGVPVDPSLFTNGYGGFGQVRFAYAGQAGTINGGDFAKNDQRQLNVVDSVSWVTGAHQIKFGIDFRRLAPTYAPQAQQNVVFSSQAAVISGIATTALVDRTDAASPRFINFSAYGQDTWQAGSRLTLSLGLRWDLNPAPTEANGHLPAIVLGVHGTDVTNASLAPAGTPLYQTFYGGFAPRVGAAYQLNRTSGWETTLRGGFGIFYDLGSTAGTTGFPFSGSKILSSVPFPLSSSDAERPSPVVPTSLPTTSNLQSNDQHLKLPYTRQWNVGIEQAFGTRQSLSLSYVGAVSRRLLTTQYLNNPVGFTTGPRPNPNLGQLMYSWNGATSDYHSLQAQYHARLVHGVQALANYTWSHAIDDVSSDLGVYALTRGSADFDVRHNFSAALTYDIPSPGRAPLLNHLLGRLLGHWSLDGIVHAQTGLPINIYSALAVVDGVRVYVRPDRVDGQPLYLDDPTVPGGRRINAAAFAPPPVNPAYPTAPLRQGTFGRNVLRQLPLTQVDMALGRTFALVKTMRLQVKGELFNIFNHPLFAIDPTVGANLATPATFGVPTQTLRYGLSSGAGLNALYQLGGPRSVQLSMRLQF
jgi:hypothetical protein